jgi:large exoprotein involved in heme utilization and adhesion
MHGGGLFSGTLGPGNAGNITVQTSVLNLSANDGTGAEINASTSGPGRGGNISIQGVTGSGSRANSVSLSDVSSLLSETLESGGPAGSITVEAVRLRLTEGSEITTASRRSIGNAGNITLNATESIVLSGSFVKSNVLEGSTGAGGSITITTNDLTVGKNTAGRGGLISTSTTALGNAGTVTINADRVMLTDGGKLSSNSAHEDSILPPPDGAAGTVLVQGVNGPGTRTSSIVISGQDGFHQSSGIFSDTQGTDIGGDITLHVNSVTIQNGGKLSVETSGTQASAIGGTITVNANHVQLNSGATITANSNGVANAGNINIIATDGLTMQNSSITTLVHPNNNGSNTGGGNIKITTSPAATVYLHDNSTISASVADGPGGGGNVTIDPQYVILQGSQILAQTDQGTGGNITIIANVFQPDATSIVSADAERGVNGTVTIQSPNAPASGKIQPLGNRPLQATALLTKPCAAMAGGKFSSFTVAGRDALPTEPGGWLASPLAPAILLSHDGTMTDRVSRVNPAVSRGEVPFLSIRQIAPSGFLTKAFAVDSQAGCKS